MKIQLTILAGALALGASLQASTATFTFTAGGTNPVLSSASPYSGTLTLSNPNSLNGTYTLICDDFADHISVGGTYSADVTNVGTGTINATDTRYGGSASATTLYDEMAWLGTQMMGTSNNYDRAAIQEAIWTLGQGASASYNTTWTGVGQETQTYAQWEQDSIYAITYVGSYAVGNAASYLTPAFNNWVVITATNATGCTTGTTNFLGGCGNGNVNQEFLAFQTGTNYTTGTPEPASFVLIGSGLLAGAFFGRRRMAKSNS